MPFDEDEASAGLELLDSLERQLLGLDRAGADCGVDREAVHSLFRTAHSIKSAVALRGNACATGLVHHMESSFDAMRSGRIGPTKVLIDAFLSSTDLLRACLEGLDIDERHCLDLVDAIELGSAEAEGAAADSKGSPGFELRPEEERRFREATAAGEKAYVAEKLLDGSLPAEKVAALPVFESIAEIGTIIASRPTLERVVQGRESLLSILFATSLGEEELFLRVFDPFREVRIPRRKPEEAAARAPEPVTGLVERRIAPRRDVRVETEKLDKLFDLVGELITAEAMLRHCADLAGLDAPQFSRSCAAVEKITRDLQETTTSIRMVPLEGLFDRVERLVRDTSRKLGKKIELRVSGGEVEMDKNAIELLSDPLAHLVRNAIDHGIESAEARRAAGKGEEGTIGLEARQEGSEILVSISDDGAGLDREAILRKARQAGLLRPGECEPDDETIWSFIFQPGFSTSEEVTEVSGRGVGLDVVRRNLEKMRGRVSVSTHPGRGSCFVLRVPLTLAIIDAISVRAGGRSYAIPVADVREFFRLEEALVTKAGCEVVSLRKEHLPLIRLGEELARAGASGPDGAGRVGVVLVVGQGARKACLLVDEVVGSQQVVIKPLPGYMGGIEGISGCSIGGDGSVSLIVDTVRLVARCIE